MSDDQTLQNVVAINDVQLSLRDSIAKAHSALNELKPSVLEKGTTGDPEKPDVHTSEIDASKSELLASLTSRSAAKPTLRILHHLACSGGSIISRCLAAMPNTYVLSEANPDITHNLEGGKAKFAPTDIISLANIASIPQLGALTKKIFADSIISTYDHLASQGAKLVIRDHSHTDFCAGSRREFQLALYDCLRDHFQFKSLLTVRNPSDSYLSLKENGWLHFEPQTFDEYCSRYLCFIRKYEGAVVLKYEDFIADPTRIVSQMCEVLEIKYDANFSNLLSLFPMTGESGRFDAGVIASRGPKQFTDEYAVEVMSSENYKELCSLLSYDTKIIQDFL